MQCRNCGNTIKDGELACQLCQMQVRMVPDYSPEDEVLIHQVRSALEQKNEPAPSREQREQTGQLSTREVEIRRRKQAERRRVARKKQQIVVGSLTALILCLLVGLSYFIYTNSYTGILAKADKYRVEKAYESAAIYYNKAIEKKSSSTAAYQALAEMHIYLDDLEQAEMVLLNSVEVNNNSYDMYMLVIEFYLEMEMYDKVMPFLNKHKKQSVIFELEVYVVEQPEFSLPEGIYDDVREVSLTSIEEKIYFVTGGDDATVDGEVYDGPIQLSTGTTVVSFIAENELGITSIPLKKTYEVELPIEGAPIVSPSTGQYTEETKITVQVPSGYTAHYTTNGNIPDASSEKYTEPVDMEEGNTIFSVILVNSAGRASDVTKRNYELVLD